MQNEFSEASETEPSDIETDVCENSTDVEIEPTESQDIQTDLQEDIGGFFTTTQLSDADMSSFAGEECVGYGTGESHDDILAGAGYGFYDFEDPRSKQTGTMDAHTVYINTKSNVVQGIDFYKNGEYCCSYTGINYDDIRDSNRLDCQKKIK